jgi:hypothetical protein
VSAVVDGRPTLALDNGALRLEVLADGGPRIVRLLFDGEDILAEAPGVGRETPWGPYRPLGGHRLWHAPEDPPWTCVPDDDGLSVTHFPRALRLERHEVPTGLRKAIEVEVAEEAPEVTLRHLIRNEGDAPVTLAAWAITVLPLHGTAILPQNSGPFAGAERSPNRTLVLWPYSSYADRRLHLGDDLVLVRGEPGPELKIGQLNTRGWAAYLRDGILLCKTFDPQPAAPYPDLGCNVEVYSTERFLELETLGPLRELAPGEETWHEERWRLHRVEAEASPEGIAALVARLGLDQGATISLASSIPPRTPAE